MDNDVVDLILKIDKAKEERDVYLGVRDSQYQAKDIYVKTLEKQLEELKKSKQA